MFQQFQLTRDHRTGVTLQRKMESRVVIFDGIYVAAHLYFGGQLFPDLPLKSVLRRFARFYLAPGKLPAVLELAVTPLGGKQLVVFDNDGCYNMDGFHAKIILGKWWHEKGRILPKSILKTRQTLYRKCAKLWIEKSPK